MGLGDDDPHVRRRSPSTPTRPKVDLAANEASVRNIRIWDPSAEVARAHVPAARSGCADYYRVNDVDIDRYDARTASATQVVLSRPRPQHGQRAQRVVGGPAPAVHPRLRRDRRPGQRQGGRAASRASWCADVPVRRRRAGARRSSRPAVYFGENLSGYVMTGTKQRRDRLPGRRGHRVHGVRRRRRRGARQHREAGRLRPALRRLQPAHLATRSRASRRSTTCATSAIGWSCWLRSSTTTPTRTR